MAEIQLIKSPFKIGDRSFNNSATMKRVADFYHSVPFYRPTPLINLKNYAQENRLAGLAVKDESVRFCDQLKAFKATGGLYAMAVCIAKRAGLPVESLRYSQLMSPAVKEVADQLNFYTATDGNHGRGVAWAAEKIRTHAVVKMPAGSTRTRAEHFAMFNNAEVEITDKNYDDTVRLTQQLASQDPNGVLI